jgi:LemA protein
MTGVATIGTLLVVFLLLGGIAVSLYNRLVRARIMTREGFSGIDVQLKRRHDLIPNLVSTVEDYADFERSVLNEITTLRGRAMGDQTVTDKQRDEGLLSGALKSLFALAEAYPDLKANESFLALQSQLSGLEDAIQNARRYYNAIVRDLNTACDVFPSNLVAGGFGITKKDYFEIEDAARETPEVDFGAAR